MTALGRPLLYLACAAVVAIGGCGRQETRLSHDFATEPDGPVAAMADSGQHWTQTASRPAAVPAVVGGKFTNADTTAGVSASYLTAQLSAPATHLEAEFEFALDGSTDGQNVTLIAGAADFPGGSAGIGKPPDLALHVAFTSTGWIWSYIEGGSGALTTLKTVYYPHTISGTARQRVAITLDRAKAKGWVQGADGVITEVAHPTIESIPSPYVTFEVYYGAANTDKRASVVTVGADSS
jgi:hypothetical protein